jgi:hypothetical protein
MLRKAFSWQQLKNGDRDQPRSKTFIAQPAAQTPLGGHDTIAFPETQVALRRYRARQSYTEKITCLLFPFD